MALAEGDHGGPHGGEVQGALRFAPPFQPIAREEPRETALGARSGEHDVSRRQLLAKLVELLNGGCIQYVDRAGIQDDPFDRCFGLGYGLEQALLEIVDVVEQQVVVEAVDEEPRISLRLRVVLDIVEAPDAKPLGSAQYGVMGPGSDVEQPDECQADAPSPLVRPSMASWGRDPTYSSQTNVKPTAKKTPGSAPRSRTPNVVPRDRKSSRRLTT